MHTVSVKAPGSLVCSVWPHPLARADCRRSGCPLLAMEVGVWKEGVRSNRELPDPSKQTCREMQKSKMEGLPI